MPFARATHALTAASIMLKFHIYTYDPRPGSIERKALSVPPRHSLLKTQMVAIDGKPACA